jgi:hypothetical protein
MTKMSNDNVRAAVDKVVSSIEMTISPMVKDDDGPADKQVLIRATGQDRDRWKRAAEESGNTLSAWIRGTLNSQAKTLLECEHPAEMTRFYPWATMCMKCGKRLNQPNTPEVNQ